MHWGIRLKPSATPIEDSDLASNVVARIDELVELRTASQMHLLRGILSKTYSTEFLLELPKLLEKDTWSSRGIARGIAHGLTEIEIKEVIHYFPLTGMHDYENATVLIGALRTYPKFWKVEDLRLVDKETQAGIVALLKVTDAIIYNPHGAEFRPQNWESVVFKGSAVMGRQSWYLSDGDLATLTYENAEHVDRITEIIRKCGTVDIRTIAAAIEGTPLPMVSGHL